MRTASLLALETLITRAIVEICISCFLEEPCSVESQLHVDRWRLMWGNTKPLEHNTAESIEV